MMDKLKSAGKNYGDGYTCSQAIALAYADELGLDSCTVARMFEGYGGGFGGLQEVCGALSAAMSIVSYYASEGNPVFGEKRAFVYKKIRRTAELFEKEYGAIRCRDVLHGESPKAFQCGMKIKDAVLIIDEVLAEIQKEKLQQKGGIQNAEE